jgi:hypothetical protein
MALMREPIRKPTMTSDGRWGPNDGSTKQKAYFYFVKDGDHWGSVAAKDGWSDVKAFIRFNMGTDDPYEVNWYLKHYVGCKLQTEDKNNFRFSSAAAPGYIFTRNNLQPANQPQGSAPPMPRGGSIDPNTPLKPVYGPPKAWFVAGAKVGGMAGPLGGDLIALVGVSLSGPMEGFMSCAYTTRIGGGLGASAGFTVGLISGMQHPNQLMDYYQAERSWDANVSIGIKAGDLHKCGAVFQPNGPLHQLAKGMANMVATGVIGTTQGATAMFTTLKSSAQSAMMLFEPKGSFEATLIDIPFGGIGTELSVFKARTGFRPFRTVTRTPEGDLVDITIPPDWLY